MFCLASGGILGPHGQIAPVSLRLQGASHSRIIKISAEFESASPRLQDVIGRRQLRGLHTGFNSPEENS
jgi:hypothetical protein